MATTKELEKVFGLSSSKIDAWARDRDCNFLLVQFLKSFSKYEIEQRLSAVLSETEYERKTPDEFINKLETNLNTSGIKEFENTPTKIKIGIVRPLFADMVIEIDSSSYILEYKNKLPSKSHLTEGIKRFQNYADKHKLKLERIIYVSNFKNLPLSITKDTDINALASFYRFDDIAEKLFGKKVILTGSI